jgi:hypothetical protein
MPDIDKPIEVPLNKKNIKIRNVTKGNKRFKRLDLAKVLIPLRSAI